MRAPLVLLALAACSSSGGGGAPAGPSCADRANEVGAWLAAIEPEGAAAQISGDHLARGPGLPLAPGGRAPLVQITHDGILLDGAPVAISDFAERLAADRAPDHFGDPARPARVILAIDGDVRLDDVVRVTAFLFQAGATDVGLAFAYTGKVHAAPMASAVSAQLDAIRRAPVEQRARQVAQLAAHMVAPCKPLGDVFAKVSADPSPEARTQQLIRGVAPALTACDCAIDLDAFRDLMWRLLGPSTGAPKAIVDVTLGNSDYDHMVRGGVWSDHVADLIESRGKRVHFTRMPLMTR